MKVRPLHGVGRPETGQVCGTLFEPASSRSSGRCSGPSVPALRGRLLVEAPCKRRLRERQDG
jgi:hypothetical protein